MIQEQYFDRDRCWLLDTYHVELPEQNDRKFGYFFVDIEKRMICFGGKNERSFETWPGDSWNFEQFLAVYESSIDTLSVASIDWCTKRIFTRVNLSWFIPLLQKMIGGEQVKYEEANAAYQSVHPGKNLRLYPMNNSPIGFPETYMAQQDYNY